MTRRGRPAAGSSRSRSAANPLDPGRTYRVAANEYMFGGGDGYAALPAGRL